MILGAGSLGKSVMEVFVDNNVLVYGFLDDDTRLAGKEIGEVTVLGPLDDQDLLAVIGDACEAFVAMEETEMRRNLVQMLNEERKVMPVNAIHGSVVLASSAAIGHGNYIGAGAVIGSHSTLGSHLVIHPGAIINHEARLGDYVQVGSGSVINSGVEIAEEVFIGSGVTVVSGIKIGRGARLGAGSVVIKDIAEGETVFGNPAGPV